MRARSCPCTCKASLPSRDCSVLERPLDPPREHQHREHADDRVEEMTSTVDETQPSRAEEARHGGDFECVANRDRVLLVLLVPQPMVKWRIRPEWPCFCVGCPSRFEEGSSPWRKSCCDRGPSCCPKLQIVSPAVGGNTEQGSISGIAAKGVKLIARRHDKSVL